jgi:pSer/pThr/pTyr-binding forkhead associated (FHA) protein
VAFVLKVIQGKDAGEEYSIDGGEARLGRTADNDVVVRDPSSSRAHARVFEKNGRVYAEDLKSANGTKLNGSALKTLKELSSGDVLAIGDVAIKVLLTSTKVQPDDAGATMATEGEEEGSEPDGTAHDGDADDAHDSDDAQNADVDSTAVKLPKVVQAGRGAKQPASLVRRPRTALAPPVSEPDDADADADADDEPSNPTPHNARDVTPAARRNQARELARREQKNIARPRARADSEELMTAAERARDRRVKMQSAGGRFALAWGDLSKPARYVLGFLAVVLIVGSIGGAGWYFWPRPKELTTEVVELKANADPIPDVYGLGDGVDVTTADQKLFSILPMAPTRVVGVLHYQARDISQDEVAIQLNGTELDFVPADTVDPDNRWIERVLPATLFKAGEDNKIVFDNVSNPPKKEAWRIWNVWVEVIPIPEMTASEAARRAQEDVDKAYTYFEQRDISAENLFRSWKTYRDAWLQLESTENAPKELVQIARTRMREIRPDLDVLCNKMVMKYMSAVTTRAGDRFMIRGILAEIPRYFPAKEHPCFFLARNLMRELDKESLEPTENK